MLRAIELVVVLYVDRRVPLPPGMSARDFLVSVKHVEEIVSELGSRAGLDGRLNVDIGLAGCREPECEEWGTRKITYTIPQPFDFATVRDEPAPQRDERVLTILIDAMKQVAPRMGWDAAVIENVASEVRGHGFRLTVEVPRAARSTRSRRHRARVFVTLEYPRIKIAVVLVDRTGQELARRTWLPPDHTTLDVIDQHCRSTRWWNGRFVIKGNAIHPPWSFDFTDVLPKEDWE